MTDDPTRPHQPGDGDADERLLHEALDAEARRVRPRSDWGDVVRRAERRRSRPAVAVAAVLLALVGGGVALATSLSGGGEQRVETEPAASSVAPSPTDDPGAGEATDEDPSPTTTAPTTATTEITTTETTTAPGAVAPALGLPRGRNPLGVDELVAVVVRPADEIPEQELVVLSATTGEELRTLATGFHTAEGGIFGLALTRDRRTVLFGRATSACTSDVLAVAVDSPREPVEVAPSGDAVAVSHRGTVAVTAGDSCQAPRAIDLTRPDGTTATFPLPAEVGAISSLAFDGEDALLYLSWDPAFTERTLRRLDLVTGESSTLAPGPAGSSYHSVRPRSGGGATVLGLGPDGGWTLVRIDHGAAVDETPIAAGEVNTALVDGAGRVLVVSVEDGEATLEVDGTTRARGVVDVAG